MPRSTGTIPGAEVHRLDLTTEPPPAERYDVIITLMTMHHVADLGPVLAGFAELLVPGGHLCISDLDREDGSFHGEGFAGHHGFDRDELGDNLRAAGFAAVTFADCHALMRDGHRYTTFLATATMPTGAS